MARVKDRVTGDTTTAYEFDGQDEGGTLRQELRNSASVPEDAEVVVGSWRLYIPQRTTLPDASEEVETEIVQRFEWLVWDTEEGLWAIYPPKLFAKFFEILEEAPDGDA